MENVNKQRRNCICLSELKYGPLKFSFRRVRLKTERKQIDFLRDVLVAVASLDLKVPIICICVNTEDIKLRPEQKSPRASYAAAQNKLLALKKCQSALAL